MAIKIIGKTRIFKKEFENGTSYSTTISKKNEDGTYKNLYVSVGFKKGKEIEGNIEIKDGFITFYETNTGLQKIKLVILDYIAESENATSEFIELNDDSFLPF